MKRLVINADDFGYEPNVTRGIERSMREGVVSSATMMVNTPFSEAAARQASGLSLGLHLNLARFHAVHRPEFEFVEARAATLSPEFVEAETLAQLVRLEQLIGRPATHIDVHKHLHTHANVLEGLMRAALVKNLPVRSISPAMRGQLLARQVRTNAQFIGDAGAQAYWSLAVLEQQLAQLSDDGVTELMCHPGYAPTEIPSGYGVQREVELATFTSPEARTWLSKFGVTVCTWAEV